jgi:beta-xylosidase
MPTGLSSIPVSCPSATAPWQPDQGDGTYRNPVLHADYSDPDAIRVGEDYWLVASSFSHVPGLPVLHSSDLVNWTLVAHALPRLVPEDVFASPQHGKGVWAPALRHHAGRFWIYYPDPDFGLYVITAADPRGPWTKPLLVQGGKGLIDPCPLWDDDGRVYLIHAWAKSRSGICNRLTLLELSPDGTRVIADHGVILDGDRVDYPDFKTLEGPKLHKFNGWYYISAPAGGVEQGWQSVFRSRCLQGPFEHKVVLAQGNAPINGPHQGALLDTPDGEGWFLHFQDKDAYGRIVHLQPVTWRDGWPVMGEDPAGTGTGQPVVHARKPQASAQAPQTPATSDGFDGPVLGLQWQWQANPQPGWHSLVARPGWLRLAAQPPPALGNLFSVPSLLLQKFPAEAFCATVKLELAGLDSAEGCAGLIIFGFDYAWLGRRGQSLVLAACRDAETGGIEHDLIVNTAPPSTVWLRVTVTAGAVCRFAWSEDGLAFQPISAPEFRARKSRWVGAKFGVFASGTGSADFDDVNVGASGD